MSKRYFNTEFWDDRYIDGLDPSEKLLFIYVLTSPKTNIVGVYQIQERIMAAHTGLDKEMIIKILKRFDKDKKFFYCDGYIYIKNFIKHQSLNTNMKKGLRELLDKIDDELLKQILIWDPKSDLIEYTDKKKTEILRNDSGMIPKDSQNSSNVDKNININKNKDIDKNKDKNILYKLYIDIFHKKYMEIHNKKFDYWIPKECKAIKNILKYIKEPDEFKKILDNAFRDKFWCNKITPSVIYSQINYFKLGETNVHKDNISQDSRTRKTITGYDKYSKKYSDLPDVSGEGNIQNDTGAKG